MSPFLGLVHPVIQSALEENWFDILSLLGGIVYAARQCKKATGQKWISKATGLDVANGVGLFPLFMLVVASFSGGALQAVLHSKKLYCQ